MNVCLHVYLCTVCVPGAQRPEEGVRYPGAGVIEGHELPCESWELNLDPPYLTVEHLCSQAYPLF